MDFYKMLFIVLLAFLVLAIVGWRLGADVRLSFGGLKLDLIQPTTGQLSQA